MQTAHQITWDDPENQHRTLFDHYEYMLEGDDKVFKQTFFRKTHHYCSVQAGTLIPFKVYAVDKCGRKSDYEVKNISVTVTLNSQ